ncbi:ABC transporter permease [uncultured Oscillibacter sp.]|uniref:ABC transporter permease n=1 Tax=uncultured Oscillibacter sp. TaxID=876091 RepID=UPI00261A32BD|nr:ABC transporter permease [uncultured Oscillibacter sp.]
MKKFFHNLYRYKDYAVYSAVASLKAEVNGSFLNWLWWILDPFLFMMVYSFVSIVVFGRSEPHFIPFVFVGYGMWQFINRSISSSVKLVRGTKSVLSRIYLPKYILLFSKLYRHMIQLLITLGLTFLLAAIDYVMFTWRLLYVPVIIFVAVVLVFGISCIVMHCGVYARDLGNVMTVVLKLVFYLSGVFYSVPKRIQAPYGQLLLRVNPAAMLINELRNVILYGTSPDFALLGQWFLIGVALSAVGIHLVHKYEQNYIKAV